MKFSHKFSLGYRKKLALACLVFAAAALAGLTMGATFIPLTELWGSENGRRIFLYVRLPRTVACLAAGAALATSGAIIQAVLSNPLAAPNIIGVNAGAGLGVTICCAAVSVTGWPVTVAAFLGALASVLLVLGLAQKTGASRTTILLAGVAVSACLNAATEAINTLLPDVRLASADFRVGGFSSVSVQQLWPAAILIGIALLLVMTLTNEIDVLALGEETAHSLGLPVKRIRLLLLVLAALLAGAAVSFAGLLGFVGLLVPHMVRSWVGNESRKMLPICVLFGAAFVTVCDVLSRVLFAPYEFPAGVLIAFCGGPFFLFRLLRQKGGFSHA